MSAGRLNAVCVDHGGTVAVTASDDCTARVWELETGRCLHVLQRHDSWVADAAVTRDGLRCVTAGGDGLACLWECGTGALLVSGSGGVGGWVGEGLAYLRDWGTGCGTGTLLVSRGQWERASEGGALPPRQTWDVGGPLPSLTCHADCVLCVVPRSLPCASGDAGGPHGRAHVRRADGRRALCRHGRRGLHGARVGPGQRQGPAAGAGPRGAHHGGECCRGPACVGVLGSCGLSRAHRPFCGGARGSVAAVAPAPASAHAMPRACFALGGGVPSRAGLISRVCRAATPSCAGQAGARRAAGGDGVRGRRGQGERALRERACAGTRLEGSARAPPAQAVAQRRVAAGGDAARMASRQRVPSSLHLLAFRPANLSEGVCHYRQPHAWTGERMPTGTALPDAVGRWRLCGAWLTSRCGTWARASRCAPCAATRAPSFSSPSPRTAKRRARTQREEGRGQEGRHRRA